LREALAKRPQPKRPEDANLVFITRFGQSWHVDSTESPISYEFGKLLRKLRINGRRSRTCRACTGRRSAMSGSARCPITFAAGCLKYNKRKREGGSHDPLTPRRRCHVLHRGSARCGWPGPMEEKRCSTIQSRKKRRTKRLRGSKGNCGE